MSDTAPGESVFGFATRWTLDPTNKVVIDTIAKRIQASLFGTRFDIRIVERSTDSEGNVIEHESEILVDQCLLAVTNLPNAGMLLTTEEDVFHFAGPGQFGNTLVTQIGTNCFHFFVPHGTGLNKFHFYNARP